MIVTVVWATPQVQDIVPVEVSPGATLADAVRSSGLIEQYGLDPQVLRFALFGDRADEDTTLAPGDRVEIVRPLVADPRVARTHRARARHSSKKPTRNGRPRER